MVRDPPKRAALSEHDAEFQDLLLIRHSLFDFFHFVFLPMAAV